jgi:hypothetical protein
MWWNAWVLDIAERLEGGKEYLVYYLIYYWAT